MNKQTLVNQLKQMQVFLERLVTKTFGWKLHVKTSRNCCRISIPPFNETEVFERERNGVRVCRSLLRCDKKRLRGVMMMMLDDGLSVKMRHYSPLLRPSYFNSSEKYKMRQVLTSGHLTRNSLHQRRCAGSVLVPSRGCNAFLSHGTKNTPVQHNCIRSYSTCRQVSQIMFFSSQADLLNATYLDMSQLNTCDLHGLLLELPQETCIKGTADNRRDKFDMALTSIVNNIPDKKEYVNNDVIEACNETDKICLLNTKQYPNETAKFCKECKNSPTDFNITNSTTKIKTLNQVVPCYGDYSCYKSNSQHMSCMIQVRQLHTNVGLLKGVILNKAKSGKGLKNPLGNTSQYEPRKNKRDTLNDCQCVPDQVRRPGNTEMSEAARKLLNDLNMTKGCEEETSIKGEKGQRGDKGPMRVDVATIKDRMKQCKGIRGRNSIISGNERDLGVIDKSSKSKPFTTDSRIWSNYVQTSHARLLLDKWQNTPGSIGHGITDNDYILVDKTKDSFFRGLAKNLLKLFRGQDEQFSLKPKLMRNAWYNGDAEAITCKSGRYDFTIKQDYKDRNDRENQAKNMTIKKKTNLKIVAEDINKICDNDKADGNCSFMTQFRRRSDNIKLYNALLKLKSYDEFSQNPEIMLRFYRIMKSVMKDMDNVVNKKETSVCAGREDHETEKNERCESNEQQSSPTDEMDNAMRGAGDLNQCRLFSIQDQMTFKDTCLHVKIKPLNKLSRFSDIQIDDMNVEVVDMHMANKNQQSSLPNPDTYVRSRQDKCLLLNLKLKLPFSSKDFS